ncbi:MAG: PilZ domain-containing protein [Thermodesulfobacteriota bacterium]
MLVRDKRQYPRYKTAIDVMYSTSHEEDFFAGRLHHFGQLVDVSRYGARILADTAHQPNEEIILSCRGAKTEEVACRVRWITRTRDHYTVGVQTAVPLLRLMPVSVG